MKQVSRSTLASKDKAENSPVKPSPRKSVATTKSPESPMSTKAPVHSQSHEHDEHDDHEHDDHEHDEHDDHEHDDHEHDDHEHDEEERRQRIRRYRRHLHHIIRKIIRHKMNNEDDD